MAANFESPRHEYIKRCAKAYLEANDLVLNNPFGLSFRCGPKEDPLWAEYYQQCEAFQKADSDLWMATEVEYSDEDLLAQAAWEWRYWRVMSRKCCYYQKSQLTYHKAGETMQALRQAESVLMAQCGLTEYYKPACFYLEKHFPGLRSESTK